MLSELAAARGVRTDTTRYEFEAGTLDMARREFCAPDGTLIELPGDEHELLAIVLAQPRRVLSRDHLMQLLKGRDWSPMDRSLDGHVARLRKKIEPAGAEAPRLIKSVRGVGYVFTGTVVRLVGNPASSA